MQQCFQNKSFPFPSLFLQTSVTSRPTDWHIFDASWTPSCGGNQAAEGNQPALLYIVWSNSSLVPGVSVCQWVRREHAEPTSQTGCETLGKHWTDVVPLSICCSPGTASPASPASPLCYFCRLVTSVTLQLFLPPLTFSHAPRVNFSSQRCGISCYSLLSITYLLNLLSNLVDLYFKDFGTHLSCLIRDAFSLISTTRRDFGWSFPWTHSCILSPYHHHSDWKEIWLCSPQLLQFLRCQKHLWKSYCLITSWGISLNILSLLLDLVTPPLFFFLLFSSLSDSFSSSSFIPSFSSSRFLSSRFHVSDCRVSLLVFPRCQNILFFHPMVDYC